MLVPISLGCSHCRSLRVYKKYIQSILPLKGYAATTKNPETIMNVFDRKAKRLQKDRSAKMKDYKVYEYVKEEVGYRMFDRICDIKRNFDLIVDLGCGRGYVSKHLQKDMVKTVFQCDSSKLLLEQCIQPEDIIAHKLVVDEEFLPFKDNSVDLFVSSLSLHWVNDLPGCFRQVFRALKNDGAFIGCMFGGDTLFELRVSLQLAEQELEGGFAPHISPFTHVRDIGDLLNRAGYTLLTIDVDEMTITYPGIKELMYDLKGMGENNCAWSRKPMLHRNTIKLAETKYKEMYGNDKGIPATFQMMNFIGWKPDPSQPKPAARGSGEISIKDIDKLDQLMKELNELNDKPGTKK